jgi:integrase
MPRRVSTGSLLLRKRRSGQQVWYAKFQVDGVQRKRLIGSAWTARTRPEEGSFTRKMAEQELEAMRVAARTEVAPVAAVSNHSFGVACEGWLVYARDEKQIAMTTWTDYRRTVDNHLVRQFGADTPVVGITKRDIQGFRDRLLAEGTMTRVSARKVMTLLSGVFAWAERAEWISANPCRLVDTIKVRSSGEFQVLSPEEVMAVSRAMTSEQDSALIIVAAFSGLRMGELRALRWRCVDFSNSLIHVSESFTHSRLGKPKSGKVRSVLLVDQAAAALDGLSRRAMFTEPDDLVFCTPLGRYLNEGRLRRRFYDGLQAAGLGAKRAGERKIKFHDLRHSFGTLAVQVFPLSDVQAYMGHADISTTMRYVHHIPRTKHAAELSALVSRAAAAPEPQPTAVGCVG